MIISTLRLRPILRLPPPSLFRLPRLSFFSFHQEQAQLSSLFSDLELDTSYEKSFSSLLQNYNERFPSEMENLSFLVETLRRLRACRLGYDLDSEEYSQFLANLHSLLDSKEHPHLTLAQLTVALDQSHIEDNSLFQKIVDQVLANIKRGHLDQSLFLTLHHLALFQRLSSAQQNLLRQSLSSLQAQMEQLQVYDLYEVGCMIGSLEWLGLEYKWLQGRFIDSLQEQYQQVESRLDANQMLEVAVCFRKTFEVEEEEQHQLVSFLIEQFLQKDSLSYNHSIYDYETIEGEQGLEKNQLQDPLHWQSVVLFMHLIFDKTTLFFSQHYLYYLEDLILRKLETDALSLPAMAPFFKYFALVQLENQQILKLFLDLAYDQITEDIDDEALSQVQDQYLGEVVAGLLDMAKLPDVPTQAIAVPYKRLRGFIQRNQQRFSDKDRTILLDRIENRLKLE